MHFVWGKVHYGHRPWFSWPAILAAKLPLGLLVLALAGVPLAFRRALPAPARWTLAMVAAASGFHMLALVGSAGLWGGMRHGIGSAGRRVGADWFRTCWRSGSPHNYKKKTALT